MTSSTHLQDQATAGAAASSNQDSGVPALALLQLVADSSADAVLAARPGDLTLVYANTAAHLMFGLDPASEPMAGCDARRFWDACELERLDALEPCLAQGWTGEMRQRRADGSGFAARTTLLASASGAGGGRLLVAVVRHLGERGRLETDLPLSRFIIERSADAVYLIDRTQGERIRYANLAACQALGYSREELLGLSVVDIDPEVTADLPQLDSLLARADGRVAIRRWHRRKDGSRVPVEIVANEVVIDGRPHNCCFVRDISERQAAEEALLLSEARFRSVVSNTPVVIFEGDGEGIFRLCEGVGLRALGVEPGALVGSRIADLFAPDSGVEEHWRRAIGGESVRFTACIGTRTFETHLNPVAGPGTIRTSVIGVATDLTERIERERELQQKTDELTRFTYTVSHDLKSPLVTISTFLGFLEQDLQRQDAERAARDMEFIRNAARQMTRLLDELLELSRIGRVVNPPTTFVLQELVQEARDLVAGRLVARAVALEVSERPVSILGDRPRLVEVFQNLFDNAVKFMGDQPRPLIRVEAEQVGADLVITVADNGGGIDPRHAHKIFDLFEKLEVGAEGTGIGLTLVKRIVEVQGGRIWVESDGPGRGARFSLVLPGARWAE